MLCLKRRSPSAGTDGQPQLRCQRCGSPPLASRSLFSSPPVLSVFGWPDFCCCRCVSCELVLSPCRPLCLSLSFWLISVLLMWIDRELSKRIAVSKAGPEWGYPRFARYITPRQFPPRIFGDAYGID